MFYVKHLLQIQQRSWGDSPLFSLSWISGRSRCCLMCDVNKAFRDNYILLDLSKHDPIFAVWFREVGTRTKTHTHTCQSVCVCVPNFFWNLFLQHIRGINCFCPDTSHLLHSGEVTFNKKTTYCSHLPLRNCWGNTCFSTILPCSLHCGAVNDCIRILSIMDSRWIFYLSSGWVS